MAIVRDAIRATGRAARRPLRGILAPPLGDVAEGTGGPTLPALLDRSGGDRRVNGDSVTRGVTGSPLTPPRNQPAALLIEFQTDVCGSDRFSSRIAKREPSQRVE